MVGTDDITTRANPFTRAERKTEADRRREVKRELWRWQRKVDGDAPAGWLQRQPLANNVRDQVRRARVALRAGEDCEVHLERLRGLEVWADYLDSVQERGKEAPEVARGRKTVEGARHGHEARYGTADEKVTRWNDLQTCLEQILARNTHLSLTEARRRVAKHAGCSLKTVERHTTRP